MIYAAVAILQSILGNLVILFLSSMATVRIEYFLPWAIADTTKVDGMSGIMYGLQRLHLTLTQAIIFMFRTLRN